MTTYGLTIGSERWQERSPEQRYAEWQALCNKLVRTCEGYRLDDASTALATTMATLLVGCTKDQEERDRVFGRLVQAMRDDIERQLRAPAGGLDA